MRKLVRVDRIDDLLAFCFLTQSTNPLIKMDVYNPIRNNADVKPLIDKYTQTISTKLTGISTFINDYICDNKITEEDLPKLHERNTRQYRLVYNALLTEKIIIPHYHNINFRAKIDKMINLNIFQFFEVENYNYSYQNILYIANLTNSIPKNAMINAIKFLYDKFNDDIEFETFNWIKPTMDKNWISDYIIKNLNQIEVEKYINNLSNLSSLDRAIFLFDCSSQHKDTKKLIIINLKKAWQQKQFRTKLKAKKKRLIVLLWTLPLIKN